MANSQIAVLDEEPIVTSSAPTPVQTLKGRLDKQLSGKRKILTIHNDSADGGGDAVFASLNEFAYQIPRGIPCNVPSELAEIMSNAITTTFERDKVSGAVVERRTPRFAYTLQDAPDQAKDEPVAKPTAAVKRA